MKKLIVGLVAALMSLSFILPCNGDSIEPAGNWEFFDQAATIMIQSDINNTRRFVNSAGLVFPTVHERLAINMGIFLDKLKFVSRKDFIEHLLSIDPAFFAGKTISQGEAFRNVNFPKKTSFRNSNFTNGADFSKAKFDENPDFSRATFNGAMLF